MAQPVDTYSLSNFELPSVLQGIPCITEGEILLPGTDASKEGREMFGAFYGLPELHFMKNTDMVRIGRRMRVGVVLGGGTTPGAVEQVVGLYNYLKKWNSTSTLIAFKGGLAGLTRGEHITIDEEIVRYLICEGGLGCIGTGAHLVSEHRDLEMCAQVCNKLDLTGLVVIGGAGFMTCTLKLAQYFSDKKITTKVLGASKRMEVGSHRPNFQTEIGCGFDSVTKLYSFLVGNLAADVASAQSSYHFVRLMGDEKSGSLTLEVALDTHPNVVFINEEVTQNQWSLEYLVSHICDVIAKRALSGKNYGIVLLPEGILNAVTEMQHLLNDITDAMSDTSSFADVMNALPEQTKRIAKGLPEWFVEQIMSQRKSHINEVHAAQMQVERLFGFLCGKELEKRKKGGTYIGKFSFQSHFFGYETRCQQPSMFDCQLASSLGYELGAMLEQGYSGYMVGMRGLSSPVRNWEPVATPLTALLSKNTRNVVEIGNSSVRLDGYTYKALSMLREGWVEDNYRFSMGTLSDQICTTAALSDLQHKHETHQLMRPQEKLKELVEEIKRLSISSNSFLKQRLSFAPPVPAVMRGACAIQRITIPSDMKSETEKTLQKLFPHTFTKDQAYRVGHNASTDAGFAGRCLRIGIVLSGGPAPGGHNIISGLHDFLQARNTDSVLFGFLKGPSGLLNGNCVPITNELLASYRNQGGFNLIGTSRTKIETKAQFERTKQHVMRLRLDGLVICGGDDSNTNAALLADYFIGANVPCRVVGMPKTIDADLRSDILEMSFGFDTSTKTYSQLLGNVMQECLVRRDRWHFVRLMGRAASHIAVEVALQTHPNYTIVSEEVFQKGATIMSIVQEISDLVSARSKEGKNYGVVVVPEGLIEVSRDMKALVEELNEILAVSSDNVEHRLSHESRLVYKQLPDWLRSQLLSERDPHGNVRVSLIESERLLASLVAEELLRRGDPCGKSFKFWCHFFGYQGRCALTSNFDCTYTYVLGHLAGTLVEGGATGVIGAIKNLCNPVEEWELVGLPLTSMMRLERRKGKFKPVIEKKLVDLNGPVFRTFAAQRTSWALHDRYPNRMEIRTGHLSGVHDHLPTQTLRIEFPHKLRPQAKM